MRLWRRSRVGRYLIAGLLSLLGLSLLQKVIGLPFVPEIAGLPVFYLLVPGWTLLLAFGIRIKGPMAAPLGWLIVTGFSWLVWFLGVVCVVEGFRWARRCFALRHEPAGIVRLVITGTIAAILVGVTLWPLETTVVPEWSVRISDATGQAVENARVQEVWQDYSVESEDHEQDKYSDAGGLVVFPRRTVRASVVHRLVGPALNVAGAFVHASFGPHAYVLAWARHQQGHLDYRRGEPLQERLVLEAMQLPSR